MKYSEFITYTSNSIIAKQKVISDRNSVFVDNLSYRSKNKLLALVIH